jgi:hypothetical protein
MPWFWRSRNDDEDEDDEEYSGDESYTDDEEQEEHEDGEENSEEQEDDDAPPGNIHESGNSSSTIRTEELAQLTGTVASSPLSSPKNQATTATVESAPPTDGAVNGDNNDDEDDSHDELLSSGAIPSIVGTGNRERLPSAISLEGVDASDEETPNKSSLKDPNENENDIAHKNVAATTSDTDEKQQEAAAAEEEDEVTSMQDKQSLLVLAAEHDRVDILQAILSGDTTADSERAMLLNPVTLVDATTEESNEGAATTTGGIVTTVPPLHIAVSYGSVNAVNCLLRMGADPSLRPDVAAIQAAQKDSDVPLEIPHMHRFDGMTAWELAFAESAAPASGAWSLFGSSSFNSLDNNSQRSSSTSGRHRQTAVDMAPSKREGIRHAFTAEALRCIGSDEVHRLQQLLAAGMPSDTEIGGKTLSDWCVDMGAVHCQAELNKSSSTNETTTTATQGDDTNDNPQVPKKSAVLDRGGGVESSLPALTNRLVELESLSRALSTCLDNLAEEVSVCAGLLLVGSGAQALASHVRSLKAKKERKYDELERMDEAWGNSEDELAYWVKQCPGKAEDVLAEVSMISSARPNETSSALQTSGSPTKEAADVDDEASQQRRQQLKAQIGASENKIRMLRASIADLSEENARNLIEVERRGLSGGITLVRGLRDEIREIEFQLSEVKSGEAACRAKIRLIQAKVKAAKKNGAVTAADENSKSDRPSESNNSGTYKSVSAQEAGPEGGLSNEEEDSVIEIPESERIAKGHSTAIVVRQNNGARGFLPFSLWQILLRIIGLSNDGRHGHSDSSPVMIV